MPAHFQLGPTADKFYSRLNLYLIKNILMILVSIDDEVAATEFKVLRILFRTVEVFYIRKSIVLISWTRLEVHSLQK